MLGGQLLMARAILGKTEFDQMLRYLTWRLLDTGVEVQLCTLPTVSNLASGKFDTVIIATGVRPRRLDIPGIDHPKVLEYRASVPSVRGSPSLELEELAMTWRNSYSEASLAYRRAWMSLRRSIGLTPRCMHQAASSAHRWRWHHDAKSHCCNLCLENRWEHQLDGF